jgi:hypothetical protein
MQAVGRGDPIASMMSVAVTPKQGQSENTTNQKIQKDLGFSTTQAKHSIVTLILDNKKIRSDTCGLV